jgi:hypothetical protein
MEVLQMLKTNSKKARENVKQYIINNFTPDNYTDAPPEDWNEIARFILDTFRSEKYSRPEDYRYYNYNERAAFADWCAGLPSGLDTCYFYNRSAIVDLAGILEQTETDTAKYDESDAENVLTYLIYNELIRGGRKNESA